MLFNKYAHFEGISCFLLHGIFWEYGRRSPVMPCCLVGSNKFLKCVYLEVASGISPFLSPSCAKRGKGNSSPLYSAAPSSWVHLVFPRGHCSCNLEPYFILTRSIACFVSSPPPPSYLWPLHRIRPCIIEAPPREPSSPWVYIFFRPAHHTRSAPTSATKRMLPLEETVFF